MKQLLPLAVTGFLLACASNSWSQNYVGVHASNYIGVMALDNQPASFVDGRFKYDINLFSTNFSVWNNARYFASDSMPGWWPKSFRRDTLWKEPDSTYRLRMFQGYKDFNDQTAPAGNFYMSYQIDLLNLAFHINPKIAVGFAAKTRMVANMENVDMKLLKLVEHGLDFGALWNSQLSNNSLSGNALLWNEYGFNYGQVIHEKEAHFLKGGARVKLLQGLASTYVYADNVQYQLQNSDTAIALSGNVEYGHSNNMDNFRKFRDIEFGRCYSDLGFGFDLGFVYEWRPKWKKYKYDMDGKANLWKLDQSKYELRLGASILDIGGMKFAKGGGSRNFSVNTTNADLTAFKNAHTFERADQIIDSLIANNPDWQATEASGETYFMNLPTAVSLQADVHVYSWIYINATAVLNAHGKNLVSRVRVPNQVSFTASFDHLWWGAHIPVIYNEYAGWHMGIAGRLGPVTIGITSFKALFAAGQIPGGDAYIGVRLPILYSTPSDIDNDKVSDPLDVCVDLPGLWAFKGCPDTDMDGVQDSEDICPDVAGLAEFKGCPDRDGDKVPDKDDACADVKGLVQFKGCPDSDNDSIPDPDDACPDVAGLSIFNGCPDKDGDGVIDQDDACPDVFGPPSNQGCPDSDNDGLFDFLDNCPTVFGPKENNGCPWPDTDKDGLLDKDDECPYLAGPVKNNGCPYKDTDNDGVLDKDDDCPTVPGVVENKGCPKIEPEAQEILNTAFENLEFNTGNAVIKASSFASLDELATLLMKKPLWYLQIAGHTDNVGEAQKNLILSKQRAEAVKKYLADKGVDAKRLNTLFFGETKPVATNETAEGRQKNRRVEMTVIFK